MTRMVRIAKVDDSEDAVITRLQKFFTDHPKIQVKALGSSTAEVDVRHYLLFDWLSVSPRPEGMAFAWSPEWRGFPAFGATLTVRRSGKKTELLLEGTYEPPGGFLGRLFDNIVGRRLAERTMTAFLQQVIATA